MITINTKQDIINTLKEFAKIKWVNYDKFIDLSYLLSFAAEEIKDLIEELESAYSEIKELRDKDK